MIAESPGLGWVGAGLKRPECVLTHCSGWIFTSSWLGSGGVSAVSPAGKVAHLLADETGPTVRPNGIALEPDGSFLLAHLGETEGGVFRLTPDRSLEPVLTEVAGRPIPPSNFPAVDALGRLWLSVSTTRVPRSLDYNAAAGTGLIILKDHRGARVVADGLGYANEVLITPDGETLYVNETFRRRLVRFRIETNGNLVAPDVVTTFGRGTFPDGLIMDSEGALWVTSIVSNRLICVEPDGLQTIFFEDADPHHVDWVEEAFLEGTMGRPHLDGMRSKVLRNVSSLAFGGPDQRTGYLGCLVGDSIATLCMPAAGMPLPHITYDIDTLLGGIERS